MNDFEDQLRNSELPVPSAQLDKKIETLLSEPAAASHRRSTIPAWLAITASAACAVLGFTLRGLWDGPSATTPAQKIIISLKPDKAFQEFLSGKTGAIPVDWDPARTKTVVLKPAVHHSTHEKRIALHD